MGFVQHLCDGEWVDGPLKSCDLHGQRVHRMPKMRIGPKTRRALPDVGPRPLSLAK